MLILLSRCSANGIPIENYWKLYIISHRKPLRIRIYRFKMLIKNYRTFFFLVNPKPDSIRTREKTETDKRNMPPTIIVSSDWLPSRCAPGFKQGRYGFCTQNEAILMRRKLAR